MIADFVSAWAAKNKIPFLNGGLSEMPGYGPCAEWDERTATLYLGEWLDQTCPGCGQADLPSVGRLAPPPGADWSRQHGCGHWWAPHITAVAPACEQDLDRALADLKDAGRQAVARLERRLTSDLRAFLALPADEQTPTGSGYRTGIYREGDQWVAWGYDPTREGEPIAVYSGGL